jgi:hypothetical protein
MSVSAERATNERVRIVQILVRCALFSASFIWLFCGRSLRNIEVEMGGVVGKTAWLEKYIGLCDTREMCDTLLWTNTFEVRVLIRPERSCMMMQK